MKIVSKALQDNGFKVDPFRDDENGRTYPFIIIVQNAYCLCVLTFDYKHRKLEITTLFKKQDDEHITDNTTIDAILSVLLHDHELFSMWMDDVHTDLRPCRPRRRSKSFTKSPKQALKDVYQCICHFLYSVLEVVRRTILTPLRVELNAADASFTYRLVEEYSKIGFSSEYNHR